MDNSVNCIAPSRLGAASVGEINWTDIFNTLIKQGFSYATATKEADKQYQAMLAKIQAEKEAGGLDGGDDKTQMYLLIGGAVLLAFLFMKK